jgi:putative transposase
MVILFISSLDVRNMSRPLRLELAGALYHITSRGNARKLIYLQDDDFELFLQILANVCERYNWVVHAYCLMSNHYHGVCQTSCRDQITLHLQL